MASVLTCEPFDTLNELYANISKLKPWPTTKALQECTEYVLHGADLVRGGGALIRSDRNSQPRTLVCHDMKGGYLEDRFINGSHDNESYLFYHWSLIDTFVYFSHHFVTIPPYGWINAAHRHGVKVLGTVITEWKDGEKMWIEIFESEEATRKFADALVLIAKFYRFEGWLLNVENTIREADVDRMRFFVKYLTAGMHKAIEGSEVIWYDSVTCKGQLKWQNELNDSNKCFFDACDGIFLNYNWTESGLLNSRLRASEDQRTKDIYVGLDVWGRGCPGGGGFNSDYALEKIRHEGLSVAIFAPAWTHERFGPKTFQKVENLFWAQLAPHLYVHVPLYDNEKFDTSFCRGAGTKLYHYGELYAYGKRSLDDDSGKEMSFFNLSLQELQVSVPKPHLMFIGKSKKDVPLPNVESNLLTKNSTEVSSQQQISENKIEGQLYETALEMIRVDGDKVTFERKDRLNYFEYCDSFAFNGGGCLRLITRDSNSYHRLFLVHIDFDESTHVSVVYKETESFRRQNGPILMLNNGLDLEAINAYETQEINSHWKRNLYAASFKTINEIGIALPYEGVCYLGQITVEQKRQTRNHISFLKSA